MLIHRRRTGRVSKSFLALGSIPLRRRWCILARGPGVDMIVVAPAVTRAATRRGNRLRAHRSRQQKCHCGWRNSSERTAFFQEVAAMVLGPVRILLRHRSSPWAKGKSLRYILNESNDVGV